MKQEELIAPDMYNLTNELERFSQGPDRTALKWENESGEERSITYQELVSKANKFGNVLTEAGLTQGDKVLIIMPRLIETYALYIALLKAGFIVIPSSDMLRAKDLHYRIKHAEVKAIVCYKDFVAEIEAVQDAEQCLRYIVGDERSGWISLEKLASSASDQMKTAPTKKDDIAFLSYTSGTTGHPKAVVHTHAWAFAHLKTTTSNWLSIRENDLVWATAAPGWQKWVWSPFLSVLGTGATGFVYNGKFDPDKYLSLLEKYQMNVLCCTPTEYRLMVKSDSFDSYKLEHLHSAVSAGEPLNNEVIHAFKNQFHVTVRNGYGQTENTLLIGVLKDMDYKPGSMGKATPGNIVEVIDADGQICPPGVVGDIAVHLSTPALFKEYYKDPERTAKQKRGHFYVTGDRAMKDEEGFFWFEGRSDDIIISSGYTIGPFEVEDALITHPIVKECAVVASPDEMRGHIVKAFIVLKKPVEPNKEQDLIKELQNYVKKLTAPYKYPRKIEFINELPKTTSGKVRHLDLRELEFSV